MSLTRLVSRLEALPPEIFNHVLGHLFDPAQCVIPQTSTTFRSYRFDTAILLVCKGIHDIAKSCLHYSLSWIRFHINWDTLLADPHWLNVPYIAIDRKDTAKAIPPLCVSETAFRHPRHQAPSGRIAVHVKFLLPVSKSQKEIRADYFDSPFASSMSVLVLENDIAGFLLALRATDLAYCERVLSDAKVPAKFLNTRSNEGMSLAILIPAGLEPKRYQHLVNIFRLFEGPYHSLSIIGSQDCAQTEALTRRVELRCPDPDRRKIILSSKVRTYEQTILYQLKLNDQGDQYVRNRQYANAYSCYRYVETLDHYSRMHDRQPETETFCSPNNDVYTAFTISLACNMALAHTAGALAAPNHQVRDRSMLNYVFD